MTWLPIVTGLVGFVVGGTLGALGMALCAMAGREVEIDERHW